MPSTPSAVARPVWRPGLFPAAEQPLSAGMFPRSARSLRAQGCERKRQRQARSLFCSVASLQVDHHVAALQECRRHGMVVHSVLVVHCQLTIGVRTNPRTLPTVDDTCREGSVAVAVELNSIARTIYLDDRLALERGGYRISCPDELQRGQ